MCVYIYIYTYAYVLAHSYECVYIYIYICIYRERDRERDIVSTLPYDSRIERRDVPRAADDLVAPDVNLCLPDPRDVLRERLAQER